MPSHVDDNGYIIPRITMANRSERALFANASEITSHLAHEHAVLSSYDTSWLKKPTDCYRWHGGAVKHRTKLHMGTGTGNKWDFSRLNANKWSASRRWWTDTRRRKNRPENWRRCRRSSTSIHAPRYRFQLSHGMGEANFPIQFPDGSHKDLFMKRSSRVKANAIASTEHAKDERRRWELPLRFW